MKQFCFDRKCHDSSPSRSLLIGWLMLRFVNATSSAEKQTQTFSPHSEKIQLLEWTMTSQSSCVFIGCDEWADRRHLYRVTHLFWVTAKTPFSRVSDWRHHTSLQQPSRLGVCSTSTSCFLLPVSFNSQLTFLKGSCSGNTQHGRREEKKTSRFVSLMKHHQCLSNLILSASFSSEFQFLIFVGSDFFSLEAKKPSVIITTTVM